MTDRVSTASARLASEELNNDGPKETRPGEFDGGAAARSAGRASAPRRAGETGLPDDDGPAPIVPLTRAQAERLFGPQVSRASRVTPFRVVGAQMALSVVVALAWGLFYRPALAAMFSAFLGGAICWLPGALFAARLARPGGAGGAFGWMLGEALRIGLAVAMFIAIAHWYPGVQWVPLLVTCLVALKTYWIALMWR